MPVDEALAERVRQLVSSTPGFSEKRMFGGLAFLINGNMRLGVHATELIVRINPAETDAALAKPGVRVFDLSGKAMTRGKRCATFNHRARAPVGADVKQHRAIDHGYRHIDLRVVHSEGSGF